MMTDSQHIFRQVFDLIERSNGEPIPFPSGETYCFRRKRSYDSQQLSAWQTEQGIELPEEYRSFLLDVGACEIFYGGSGHERGINFYALDEIYEIYKDCFDEPEAFLFTKLLPVAGDENLQEIAAFAIEKEPPNNFSPFWHECPPEDWINEADELNDWQTFSSWLQSVVEHEGRRPL
ncbi:MAG TPA: SMI1/KNR4 family protein [Pyrinomonadaceae bacterium]|jgi:hypothetical protein